MRHFSLKQFRDGGAPKTEAQRRGRDSPVWWIVPSGVALIAVIAFGTALLVSSLRERARADAKHALDTTAYIIAEHLEGTFQSVELAQRSAIERMQSLGIASSDDLDRLVSNYDAHLMLKDIVSGAPQLDTLMLVNPSGKLVGSSRIWPMPDITDTDREYFKALTADNSLNLFLGGPARSRLTGAWTTHLARRFVGPNGEYIGIVVGIMELRHFEQFFGSISVGNDVAIALFRSDGMLLARDPHVAGAIGTNGSGTLFEDTWSAADGKDRLTSLQALTHYPVVASVSTTESAALAQWSREAKIIVGAVGLAASSIGVFILFIVHKLMQGIRRSRQRLRGQKLQLDTALNNMSQGLLMCDSEDRVVLCNRRYMEIYGVPADMVERGCTRRELIAHHFTSGLLTGDPEQYMTAVLEKTALKAPYSREVETADGHTISVISSPMEGGLRVSTHEDVTDRRRAEQERDRSRDLLDRVIENIPVTVFVKDARTLRYILINRAGERLWGVPREQLVGKTPR